MFGSSALLLICLMDDPGSISEQEVIMQSYV